MRRGRRENEDDSKKRLLHQQQRNKNYGFIEDNEITNPGGCYVHEMT